MIFSSLNWKKILLLAGLVLIVSSQFFISQALAQTATTTTTDSTSGATLNYQDYYTPKATSVDGACTSNPSTWLNCVFLIPIAWFMGLFVSLGAAAITWGLQMNADLANTAVVQSGFNITLAVANLGFVFAIIIIAIATIVGYESYGMKKNLWRLVVAALLVNFSLVICSFVIGFFDQFAYYFAKQMGSTQSTIAGVPTFYSGVGDQLVNAFQVNKLAAWTGSGGVAIVPTLIFIVIFMAIIAFTLLAVAFSLIVRYFFLSILMILMPIAWLAWIIPGYKKHWDTWWQTFMKWVLSPTIMLTFLYIAVAITTNVQTSQQIDTWTAVSKTGAGEIIDTTAGTNGGQSLMGVFFRMIVGLALVWGAIFVANSVGAKGGATVLNIGKAAGNKAKQLSSRGGRYALTSGRRYDSNAKATTSWLQRQGSRIQSSPLRYIPGAGTVASYVARQGAQAPESPAAIQAYIDNNLKPLNGDAIVARSQSRLSQMKPLEAAALAQELARRDKLDSLPPEIRSRFVKAAERMGNTAAVYANRPDYAERREGESEFERGQRVMRGLDVNNINHESLKVLDTPTVKAHLDPQVNMVLNMSSAQLGKLAAEGTDPRRQAAVLKTLTYARKEYTADPSSFSPEQTAQLRRVLKTVNNNPIWQAEPDLPPVI